MSDQHIRTQPGREAISVAHERMVDAVPDHPSTEVCDYRQRARRKARLRVHRLFTDFSHLFTTYLPATPSCLLNGRFPRSARHHRVRPGVARSHLGSGPGMTVTQGILLGVAVVMFIYLGFAMFKPEKF
jgi:hypothetical protein